ncbi:tetratricopeptide repeat protein [Pedobacter sp. AW31-3R]|uniref:tetratricopeptide repeat protein n=1 Tax=Pedobacter sp. AW31-3R TaxID=3445781 RepID=UPI003F9FF879
MKALLLSILFLAIAVPLAAQNTNAHAIAVQYYEDGEYQKAAALLEKLFLKSHSPDDFDLYLKSLFKAKQYEDAEKMLKKLIRQYPGVLKYELALGRTYKERGEQENAAKVFSHIIATLPEDEFLIRDIVNELYQAQEYDMAIEAFLQGRKVMHNEQLFTYELLNIYRFKKDKTRLIEEYLNALANMPQLLPQAQNVLSVLFETKADYLLLQNALLKRIQKDPQNESYAKLLSWQYIQQEEYEMALRQLIAQDKRTKDDGNILFYNAQIFIANKAYDTAVKAYTYLLSKGKENPYYLPSKLAMIDARYQLLIQGSTSKPEIEALANEYQDILDEYGLNRGTLFALQKMANIQAYYLSDPAKAQESLEKAISLPGIPPMESGEIKLALGDIYVLNQEPWEAILMYEQVSKGLENQPIGNEAKYRSARLSFYQGNFSYAKSQCDVLKAATEQLISNDAMDLSLLLSENLETPADTLALKMYANAALLLFKNQTAQALLQLDSISLKYPRHQLADDILLSKSRIYIKNKEFNKAATILGALVAKPQKNRLTDDALFTLAGIYEEQLQDPEQAKQLYQRLITDFPGSMYIAEARKHYRKLRGDNIGS